MKIKENLNFFVYDFDLHYSIKNSIISTIKSSGDKQLKSTNVKAYMTDWNIQSKEIDILTRWIENKIYWNLEIAPKFVGKNNSLTYKLHKTDCWGAIYNYNDYTDSHNHAPSHVSFVYFVNIPKGSSPLIFDTSNKKIKAEEGKVIIFNSSIFHHVPKNKCNDRIVISGNYSIDPHIIINRPL